MLWTDRPDEFRSVSALAAEYFEKDETNCAEWLYHKVVLESEAIGDDGDFDRVMESLDYGYQRSEAEVVLRNIQEQIVSHRVSQSILAQTTYWKGRVSGRSYEKDEALAHYEEAIVLYRAVGARLGEANTLQAIGDVLKFKDRNDEALAHYEEAIGLYRAVGDRIGEANTLKEIGDVLQFKDRNDKALAHYEEAIGLFRAVGERLGEANTLKAIGDVLQFKKRTDEALAHYEEAIVLYRAVGERLGEANTLKAIGDLQSDFNLAIQDFFQPALKIYEQVGSQYSQGRILANSIAPTYLKLGNSYQAKTCYEEALKFWTDVDYTPGINQCKNALANINQSSDNRRGPIAPTIDEPLSSRARPKRPMTSQQKVFIGFCIGMTIALLVWKLKN